IRTSEPSLESPIGSRARYREYSASQIVLAPIPLELTQLSSNPCAKKLHARETMQIPNHVQEHIETIAKHEHEFLERRSPAERMGDLTAAIVGNLGFVAVHVI